jgi:hypothetical protein
MKRAITGLVLAALLSGCASSTDDTPAKMVETFFNTYPHRLTGGLPAGDELQWLKSFISDRLHESYVAVLAYQNDWIERHPDRPSQDGRPPIILKPPFASTIDFSGSQDGFKSFKVAETGGGPDGTRHVRVRFWWDQSTSWEHVVVVKKERGRYVIDDVLFSADEPNEAPTPLSKILAERDPE